MLGFNDIHDTKIIDVKTFDDNIKMLKSTNIIYKEASHTHNNYLTYQNWNQILILKKLC